MKTFKQITEQINENLLMQRKLSKLLKKKVTVITPDDKISGTLMIDENQYYIDGYENELFRDRDVKSIQGTKINLKEILFQKMQLKKIILTT